MRDAVLMAGDDRNRYGMINRGKCLISLYIWRFCSEMYLTVLEQSLSPWILTCA